MKMTDLFLAELEREGASTRRTLERIPEDKGDWKPHERSMTMAQLATLVATMPGWIASVINADEHNIDPEKDSAVNQKGLATSSELVAALDASVAKAREALQNTNDEHLMLPWRFMVSGHLASEMPRHIALRDSVLNHLAHHRGQLTVYLRLTDTKVPAIYGPTADEYLPV